jgi:hypothetical protein
MIDRFLSKTGVGIALLLMVAELSYVNTLSLEYMFNTQNVSATIFGIIGAIAFSSVTVLIMRLGKQSWAKVAFPLFDMLLTFCGLNLEHADHLFANPIRFAMSIILSVFAGLNTYSLGLINADQHSGEAEEQRLLKTEYEKTRLALLEKQSEVESLKGNFQKLQSNLNESREAQKSLNSKLLDAERIAEQDMILITELRCDSDELQSDYDELKTKLKEKESELLKAVAEAARYKGAALAAEVARIRKKAEKNRTPEELELLKMVA